jgi:hypothetical protein
MLNQIINQVDKKTHNNIICNIFNYLIKKHNPDYCNCEYCKVNRKYVFVKRRLKALSNNRDINYSDFQLNRADCEIYELKDEISSLKYIKHSIKNNNLINNK